MTDVNVGELVTMALRERRDELADNVTNHNALLKKLSEKGNIEKKSGGRTLFEPLEYAENGTFMYYSGYETLNITPSTVFDGAEYNWKQGAVVVSISGLERRQVNGRNELFNMLGRRLDNAEKTMKNNLSTGVYSDGSGTSGKQIGGLQLLIGDDPTSGTIGGIAPASYSWWQNQEYDFSDNSATASANTIQAAMKDLWLSCVRGSDKIDTFVADSIYFTYFWESLTDIQRLTGRESGASGFRELAFYGPGGMAEVMYDDACPASRMYGLNLDYIHWCVHEEAWMDPMTTRESVNQDASVVPIIFMGNLTCSNRQLQGVIQP